MEVGAQTDASIHTGAPEHCLQLVQALKGGNLVGLSEGGVGKHRVDKVCDRTLTGHHGLTNMADVHSALPKATSGCPLLCQATANHHQFVLQVWHAQLSP